MSQSSVSGTASIAIGCLFFAVLVYEPANIVTFLGLDGVTSEGAVVIFSLIAIGGFIAAGLGALGANRALASIARRIQRRRHELTP